MGNRFFQSFTAANSFAREVVLRTGRSPMVKRFGDAFQVSGPDIEDESPSNSNLAAVSVSSWASALAQEKLERERRLQDYEDQKSYEEAIRSNTPREDVCEACDRTISRCRCSS